MPKISNEDYETNKVQQSDFGKPVSKDSSDASSTPMFGEGFHRILQQAQQPIPQLGGWNAEQAAAPAALATGAAGYGLKKLYNAVTGKPDEPPAYEQLHPEEERSRRLKNDIMEYDFNVKKQADLQKAQATQPALQPTATQPTAPVDPVQQPVAQASTPTSNDVGPPANAPQNSVPPEIQQLQQKSADIAAAKQQDIPNAASTNTNTQDLNPAIEEAINKPAEVVKTTTDPKPNIQNTPNTEPTPAGKAARQKLTFDDTPQTAKDMLAKGTTFMPGYGPGDNSVFNTLGGDGRKAFIDKYNNGLPVGSDDNYTKLWNTFKNERIGPEISRPLRTQRGIPPSEFGNFGTLGKALKLGGVAGLGIAASNIANAAQNGNYMEAGLRGADLASDYIPGVAQVKQAFTPMNAGDPDEDAKMAAIHAGQKIGGGRGIAPPSSYIPVDPKKQWEDMKKAGLVFGNYGSSNNKFK